MADFEQRLARVREQIEVDRFDRVALLHDAQFTNSDVEAAAHVTPSQLHNWVSRGWIMLSGANPGKGKRRLYSGRDGIAVAVAGALQPFAMMQVAEQLIRIPMVSSRAHVLLSTGCRYGYALAIVPDPDGSNWLYIPLTPGTDEAALLTPSCVLLDVDRLILETVENLLLIIAGEEVPPRKFPKRQTPEEVRDQQLEVTGAAYRDENGRRIFRGLSLEESAEFEALTAASMEYRTNGGPRPSNDQRQRYLELDSKNERARLAWLGEKIAADFAAGEEAV